MSLQGDHRPEAPARNPNVDWLADCLRSELSAVETYNLALKGVTHVGVHHALQEILESHLRRTDMLRAAIVTMGGDPPSSSGIWGAFARAVQTGADLLGDRAAVGALEEGEDRTLELYASDVSRCDAETTRIIERELLPQQRHTHELCRALKRYVSAPS